MASVTVSMPCSAPGGMTDYSAGSVKGHGLAELNPTMTLSPVIQAAFLAMPSRVEIIAPAHYGIFVRTDEYCRVEVRGSRLVSYRVANYTFQGWEARNEG